MESNTQAVLKGKVLDQSIDPKLQLVATQASKVSGFPVALVNLILRRTQLYKAHTGLDGDLAAYRSIDRCLSFCQYVVKSKKPLKIFDATKEPSLPQTLVQIYGIRAYYGYPVMIDDEVVGSLCIVDSKPSTIDEKTDEAMQKLAHDASIRLTELAHDNSSLRLVNPKENRAQQEIWQEIVLTRKEIQMALADLYPVVKKVEMNKEKDNFHSEATKSYEDLKAAFDRLGHQLVNLKQLNQKTKR